MIKLETPFIGTVWPTGIGIFIGLNDRSLETVFVDRLPRVPDVRIVCDLAGSVKCAACEDPAPWTLFATPVTLLKSVARAARFAEKQMLEFSLQRIG